MSKVAENNKKPVKRRNFRQGNIYCLFASQKSFSTFQTYHSTFKKPLNLENFRKTEQGSNIDEEVQSISTNQREHLELTPVPKVHKLYHCRKCFKELLQEEEFDGICEQCVYLTKLSESGNFQKFISHLIDFKRKTRQSYKHENKLRRIQSIESIQSFTLDRMHDSQIRPSFQYFNLNKNSTDLVLNSMENTITHTKKSSIADSVNHGGYYCNGCQTEPILGRRFHCLTCEDYDLCEKCYFYIGHKHDMKTFKDMREEIANRARQGAIKRSQTLQHTLPFLSSSIRDFEKAAKLFKTTALKNY